MLNIADMTTDGAFTLGCAVSATMAVAGHPVLGLFAAMLAGSAAGFVTALLQTRLGVPSILAGIITNTGLYTVNLAVMGFSSNVPMLKTNTIFTMLEDALGEELPTKLLLAALIAAIVCALLILFLGTRLGLSIRATGDYTYIYSAPSTPPSPSRWGCASPTPLPPCPARCWPSTSVRRTSTWAPAWWSSAWRR